MYIVLWRAFQRWRKTSSDYEKAYRSDNDWVIEWKIAGKTRYPHVKEFFKINSSKKLLDEDLHKSFHRRVGKLIYLAHRCRPDVLCSVTLLSSRVQEPNEDDWNKLMRLLKCLNNASDLGLGLQPDRDGKTRLQRYCDASFNAHEGMKLSFTRTMRQLFI